MYLYSYVITRDYGFAPNPFWNICSLATCKPQIRERALMGDWVAGFGGANTAISHKMVFLMRVDDVIKEVYDSWYKFFETARELLKDIPGNRIPYSGDLIELTEKVLNIGLRPHLTKWQAKYRRWYEEELKRDSGTPQDIQKKYPEYDALVEDLIETNEKMIEYKKLMKRIVFGSECNDEH